MTLRKKSLFFFLFFLLVILGQFLALTYIIEYYKVSETNIYAVELLHSIETFNRILIIAVSLFFVFIFIYSRMKIIGPLLKLEESARLYQLEKKRFPLPRISNDEIGSLSLSIKQMIDTIERQNETIIREEKLSALGTLASGMAHEINNPIGYIQSNHNYFHKCLEKIKRGISIIQDGAGDRDIRDYFVNLKIDEVMMELEELMEDNRKGIARIHEIVEGMRSFSRIDSNGSPADLDFNELIRETLKMAKYEIDHDTELILELGEIPAVRGIEGQLSQVLLNLIINALSALPEKKGILRIRTWLGEKAVFCTVEDNGPGIKESEKDKIFDPFYTSKSPGEGSGLGLNISFNIMKNHGGEILSGNSDLGGASLILKFPFT